jgi:hypothetical protein
MASALRDELDLRFIGEVGDPAGSSCAVTGVGGSPLPTGSIQKGAAHPERRSRSRSDTDDSFSTFLQSFRTKSTPRFG